MMGHSASLLFSLATMAAAGNTEVISLAQSRLAVGQKFEIQTTGCAYRGHIVDRATGKCQLATSLDGENFSPPQTVYLLGATAGRQANQTLIMMHEIKVGMKMELGLGDLEQKNREITSEVTAIRLGDAGAMARRDSIAY
jgi:hypothetical protein